MFIHLKKGKILRRQTTCQIIFFTKILFHLTETAENIFLKYNKAEHSEWQYNFSQILSHWSFQRLSRQKKIGHFDLVFIVDNKYSKAS